MSFGISAMAWAGIASAGATVYSANKGAKAAKNAANTAATAQNDATTMSIEEQRRQFDLGLAEQQKQMEQVRQLLAPYVNAGSGALAGQRDLLGLNGMQAQQGAIGGIQSSPQFGAMVQQGEDAILANASATGGLRGGNVQASLAQFRPQLLSQLIEQQYGRLGGLTQLGQASAAGVGAAGMQTGQGIAALGANTGANIANLFQQQGANNAGAAIAGGRADAMQAGGITNGLMTGLGVYKGLGGFGQLPPGITAGNIFGQQPVGVASGTVDNTLF